MDALEGAILSFQSQNHTILKGMSKITKFLVFVVSWETNVLNESRPINEFMEAKIEARSNRVSLVHLLLQYAILRNNNHN